MHSWDKSYLMMRYYSFYVLLNLICWCFVEDFLVYVHERYWSAVSFRFDTNWVLYWSYFLSRGAAVLWGGHASLKHSLCLPLLFWSTLSTFLPITADGAGPLNSPCAVQSSGIFCLPFLLHFQTNNTKHKTTETCSLYLTVT